MSEVILKALMRLFALLADLNRERITSSSREVVEMYLNRHLSRTLARDYIKLFDDHLAKLKGKIQDPNDPHRRKRNAAHSVKVLAICQQINEELHQKEKVIVLLRLIEFAYSSGEISKIEEDFIETLGGVFSVDPEDFKNLKIFSDPKGTISSISQENRLNIAAKNKYNETRFIKLDGLNGEINIIKTSSVQLFFLKHSGSDTLYLRGQDIKPGLTYVLDPGSIIKGVKTKPVYFTAIAGAFMNSIAGEKITFTADNVEFRFHASTNGLHRFNFSETTGTLVGIMGGSGVGKSTLFGILNGTIAPQKGRILINGIDIHAEADKIKGLIGFIPQDDLLFEELTVFQNLYYNACLCFRDLNKETISNKVLSLLEDLGLYEIRDLKVGSPLNKFISGGQRKRLNIALELIREPLILFVDEPTSGLSSNDSEQVMFLLKELTLKDKLIIVNIHQPSSDIYKLFDKLLVMDKGGYVIYNGNPIDAVTYFKKIANHVNADEGECLNCGNVNPEQVLQIVDAKMVDEHGHFTRERKITPDEWFEHYEAKIERNLIQDASRKTVPVVGFHAPSKIKQFLIFSKRNIATKITNTQYLLLNLLEAPALALILAFFTKYTAGDTYLFSENKNFPAFLFMVVIVPLFLGMTVSAEEIIKDRKILQREKFLNLSRLSYLSSKTLFLLLLSAIQTFTFVIIANFILGIQGMNFYFWLTLFGVSFFSNMVGLNISAGLNSVVTIYILIPLILIPQLLLSGVIVKFEDLEEHLANSRFVPVMGDIMASRWAYEAMAVSQFQMNPYEKYFFGPEQDKSNASWYSSFVIPELKKTANICELKLKKGTKDDDMADDLEMIRTELNAMSDRTGYQTYPDLSKLNLTAIDTSSLKSLTDYLKEAALFFNKKGNRAAKQIDSIYADLSEEIGKEAVLDLKRENYNKAISDMLLNRNEMVKIVREDNNLLQKKDPVFMLPEAFNGRAHLYAPEKRLGSISINTFWFNNMVLWLMSFVLFLTLYFDVLRRAVSFNLKRKKRKE